MTRIVKHIVIIATLCLPPVALYAEAQHVLGSAFDLLGTLVGTILLLFTVTFIIMNFAKNKKSLNFITLFLSVVTLIYFVKLGEDFTIFNFTGIFISIIGLISVLKYLRYRS